MDEQNKELLEGKEEKVNDALEVTSTSELNSTPVPTAEEQAEANVEPVEPVESEPVEQTPAEEEYPGVTTSKIFTQDELNEMMGKTRIDTREKTFRYIYDRYGVNNEEELDDLIGNAQRFDSLQEEYAGAKNSWKAESDARAKELADVKEQVALMQSGIDSARYEDAKLILRGKGLEVSLENIQNELATHPEWEKKPATTHNDNFVQVEEPTVPQNTEPASKLSVLGNERGDSDNSELSEEEQAMRLFRI